MDEKNLTPIEGENREEPADTGKTIAFDTDTQSLSASDEKDPLADWEEETVAVSLPGDEPVGEDPDDISAEAEEGFDVSGNEMQVQPESTENFDAMPAVRRKNPFKRVPRRVYHRGRLRSLVYVVATVCVCVFASVMFLRIFNDVLAFVTDNKAITISIDADDSAQDVAKKMKDAGLIKYDWLFSYVAKFEGKTGPYEAGEHTLNDNMNYMQLLSSIARQKVERQTVDITFIEGMDVDEMAALLDEKGVCDADSFKQAAKSNSTYGFDFESGMSRSSDIYYPLEGYLFPDTYQFYTNSEPADVIYKMLQNFQNKIDSVDSLMKESGLTLHQTVTLASIIQAEASGDPENMKLVSSVYWNRLNDTDTYPMLQSDPTRDYANSVILMAGKSGENKRKAALYNTYECNGLPAGPICSPGMDAIMAAMQPESTAYYYFCSNIKTGEFYYAGTLQEHEENVDHIS